MSEPDLVELKALLAALEEDEEGMELLVVEMFRGERQALATACRAVAEMCDLANVENWEA